MIDIQFCGKHGTFEHKTLYSIGADICCQEGNESDTGWTGHDWVLPPGSTQMFPTGLFIRSFVPVNLPMQDIRLIPFADVRPRSSLNRQGIIGQFGTIDADYRDEIKVILTNHTNQNFRIKPGDRIGQLVCHYGFHVAEVLQQDRKGGFGSTGK